MIKIWYVPFVLIDGEPVEADMVVTQEPYNEFYSVYSLSDKHYSVIKEKDRPQKMMWEYLGVL